MASARDSASCDISLSFLSADVVRSLLAPLTWRHTLRRRALRTHEIVDRNAFALFATEEETECEAWEGPLRLLYLRGLFSPERRRTFFVGLHTGTLVLLVESSTRPGGQHATLVITQTAAMDNSDARWCYRLVGAYQGTVLKYTSVDDQYDTNGTISLTGWSRLYYSEQRGFIPYCDSAAATIIDFALIESTWPDLPHQRAMPFCFTITLILCGHPTVAIQGNLWGEVLQ